MILVILGLLSSYLIFIHYKMIYIAKLHSKKKIMLRLFEEINMVDFPKGDLQFKAGEHAAWFSIKIFEENRKNNILKFF